MPHAAFTPSEPFDSDLFVYELKIDGFRALAHIHNGDGELVSRNGNTFRGFAELATWMAEHLRVESAVLDGEIACVDEHGRPNFRDLLFRQKQCIFIAFDLLYLNGRDLRPLPLIERKALLKRLIRRKKARMFYLDHVETDGCLLFEQIVCMDLEGKLGVFAGMRCSEIFGLRRGRVQDDYVEVVERVSRRDIDTPKTEKSVRKVALSSTVKEDMKLWLESTPGGPEDWLFPSENRKMPIGADNMMARYIRPKLKREEVGLGWIDYRVMRRTHSSLMNAQGTDPKVIADQQGHTVDVNLNVYTQTSMESRQEAVEALASAFVN